MPVTTRSMDSQPITPPQPMTLPRIQRPITRSMASQPMTPARIERTREPPPAPIKFKDASTVKEAQHYTSNFLANHFKDSQTSFTGLDLSKMPKKPVSAPFVIAKSTEQQLADALAENEKFRETVNRLVDTHNAQKDEIAALKNELARYSNPHSRYVGIDFSS